MYIYDFDVKVSFIERERLVSSKSYHWTRWISDTYLLLDTCLNLDVSSDNFHWT